MISNTVLGIGLQITLHDRFSRNAEQIRRQYATLNGSIKAGDAHLRSNLQSLQRLGIGLGAVGYGGLKAINNLYKSYSSFDYSLKSIQAIAGQGNIADKQLRQLGATSQDLATKYGILPSKINDAMMVMVKGGIHSAGALSKMTEATIQLSKAADEDIGGEHGLAQMLINVMSQFNALDSKGTRSVEFVDKLATAANAATIDVRDLFESLKYGGAAASNLKIPFEEVIALFATAGQRGIKGSMAGTSLLNMLDYLTVATGKFGTKRQRAALDIFGISREQLIDEQGKLRSFSELGTLFLNAAKKLNPTQLQSATMALLGKRGPRIFVPLMENLQMYNSVLDSVNKSSGAAFDIATQRMNTAKGTSDRLHASWEVLKISAGEALAPVIMTLSRVLVPVLRGFANFARSPVGKVFIIIAAAAVTLAGVMGMILLPLSTMGLLLLTARTSFGQLRAAGVWAWQAINNQIRQAILQMRIYTGMVSTNAMGNARYPAGTIINGVPVGGRFYNPRTQALSNFGMAGLFGGIGSMGMGRSLVRARSLLGTAFSPLAKFGSIIKNLIGILGKFGGAIIPLISLLAGDVSGSNIGGLVGGIAGAFFGPLGSIVGGLLGSVVGGLFGDNGKGISTDESRDFYSRPGKLDYRQFESDYSPATVNIYSDGGHRKSIKLAKGASYNEYLDDPWAP